MKRQITLIILLVMMILSSLFTGADIKGWIFLYEFELEIFDPVVAGQYGYALLKILIGLSHLVILILPFLIKTRLFTKLLIIAPLIFIVAHTIALGLIFFLLIPFLIFWLMAIDVNKKMQHQLTS
ncbi:hypothetical protein [Pedobacter sp. Hv1]|uniref:hypothetical protein n=1 Tax=Pedobacter sp. Hv1 TaxID=1740090 RepID=UPI0006D8D4A1|nr:hypothetical protein [Pedobacter sp. Hv1]KQC01338.1 hypothetical protein AQF98_06375 [Pedobacter sp. Hv1]